jgi:hypothetical protein
MRYTRAPNEAGRAFPRLGPDDGCAVAPSPALSPDAALALWTPLG